MRLTYKQVALGMWMVMAIWGSTPVLASGYVPACWDLQQETLRDGQFMLVADTSVMSTRDLMLVFARVNDAKWVTPMSFPVTASDEQLLIITLQASLRGKPRATVIRNATKELAWFSAQKGISLSCVRKPNNAPIVTGNNGSGTVR